MIINVLEPSNLQKLNWWCTSWNFPYINLNKIDTVEIKAYLSSQSNISEAAVQQQMQQMNAAFLNSPDTSMNKLSDEQLIKIIRETSKIMGGSYLLQQDNAIIGTAFAQLALEGRIDEELKQLAVVTIKRQLLPLLIDRYDHNYKSRRQEQLIKMLEVVNKVNS